MKKKLLSAILSVAMVATVLAGCGGSSSSTGESTAAGDSAAAVEEGRKRGSFHEYIHGRCEDYHSEYQERDSDTVGRAGTGI